MIVCSFHSRKLSTLSHKQRPWPLKLESSRRQRNSLLSLRRRNSLSLEGTGRVGITLGKNFGPIDFLICRLHKSIKGLAFWQSGCKISLSLLSLEMTEKGRPSAFKRSNWPDALISNSRVASSCSLFKPLACDKKKRKRKEK